MPVKTITIDMEAYNLLAAEKREKESFSGVIKRHFRKARTAAELLERLDEVCLSERGLEDLDTVLASRADSPADSHKL